MNTERCPGCGHLAKWCRCFTPQPPVPPDLPKSAWTPPPIQHNDPGDETPQSGIPPPPTGNVWTDERGDLWASGCPACGGMRLSLVRHDGLAWCFACAFPVNPNKVRL